MPACCNLSLLGDIKSCENPAFRFLLRKRRSCLSKSAVYYRNSSLQNSPELKSELPYSTGCDAPQACFQWLHQNWLDSTPAARYAQGQLPFGHECDSVGWHRRCHLHTNSPGMPPQPLEHTEGCTQIPCWLSCPVWPRHQSLERQCRGKRSVLAGTSSLSQCVGSGLYLCSFLTPWAEDTEGPTVLAVGGQTRHRAPWWQFTPSALIESQSFTLFTQPPSESATISDSLAPKHCSKQAKEKATTKKSQKNPLWLTSFFIK